MPRQTRQEKAIDREIERLYYQHAQGKQISVLDIGKVFKAGRDALAAGQSLEAAIKTAIGTYCVPAA